MKIPEAVPWVATGKTLGSGGQADVYLVQRRTQQDSPVFALKALRNTESRQARERFRREIEAVRQLEHPSIVRIVDHSEPDDLFQFYVMEYHHGAKTLASIIFSGSNPYHGQPVACLNLLEQLLEAIQACEHAQPPIVHRDINPRNILVLPSGSLRLIDFGICQIQDGHVVTLVDEDVGARNYSAPECEAGNDTQIGTHSDLYSAAKVVWSAVTSQKAFAREEPAFAGRSMATMFPRLERTWHLTRIFEKTLRANPAHRLKTAGELLDLVRELRTLIQGGYPPIETLLGRCSSCGNMTVEHFGFGYALFANPVPNGFGYFRCSYCGYCFVREMKVFEATRARLKNIT